ncbi:HAD-superfamily hydrolase [Sistotremastrum suecicum HHB10207 ss-3]|uniref:HAD-superfamily hydrolase n=1 Tax=Sistotremastrum suecicum HHB10207 ss-3 TaxID=1314776 RepID=A0A166D1V0_9AGAM|nr:HAD-superfamily hydrolase [Sistotremastrum suecicum HHB10207 ss-3]
MTPIVGLGRTISLAKATRPCFHRGFLSPNHLYVQRAIRTHAPKPIKLAFAFDIDGVLVHDNQAIPAGQRVLKFLDGANPLKLSIPYILITNGGGRAEFERATALSSILQHKISPDHLVQSHTVLKSVVDKYHNKGVLVLGGLEGIKDVAHGYGFKRVYTSHDLLRIVPGIWPFSSTSSPSSSSTSTYPDIPYLPKPISAIFVFHDPRDWGRDIQIILDVLRSPPSETEPVELIFTNPDLIWKALHPKPRLGQGAFREAFQGVYRAFYGKQYPYVQFGKPSRDTYVFAEGVLRGMLRKNEEGAKGTDGMHVYMVGDNPASAGASAHGWPSILVRTGVYEPSNGEPAHEPTKIAEDVEEAVMWAWEREYGKQ